MADDVIHYREYKILLQAERFTSKRAFLEFWEDANKTMAKLGIKVEIDPHAFDSQVREVLFYDTPEFDLYNNHFILRKRTFYDQGWPRADHELTFKFRAPDLEAAAAVDVRPQIGGHEEIKFKEELLLERDRLGGIRSVYSHGCVLVSPEIELERGIDNITRAFPTLKKIDISPRARLELVNNIAVEEVQNTLGWIHFHHHFKGKATIAIWRSRALERSLSGEFAFQCKFDRLEDVSKEALELSEEFYKKVQLDCAEWIMLGTTKTAMVYGLKDADRLKNRE
ncbi:MAG TPA: hypothetical protein VMF50_05710 [Candidatus Binataceae bacterium]|nr:hypothetical protein [Candidatus Binataceae bacterium]